MNTPREKVFFNAYYRDNMKAIILKNPKRAAIDMAKNIIKKKKFDIKLLIEK